MDPVPEKLTVEDQHRFGRIEPISGLPTNQDLALESRM
jgi:hypothetical protein